MNGYYSNKRLEISSFGQHQHHGHHGHSVAAVPADSSGIINMSSPSGSSDSSSTAGSPFVLNQPPTPEKPNHNMQHYNHTIPPNIKPRSLATPGKNMNLMSKIAKKDEGTHSSSQQSISKMDPPSRTHPQRQSDLFLTQFQAQMSQMKSAMDAVQNEILHNHHQHHAAFPEGGIAKLNTNNTKPSGGGGTTPRGRGRPPGSGVKQKYGAIDPYSYPIGTAPTEQSNLLQQSASIVPTYQAQLSDPNKLVLKIKKSPGATGGKKRGRKPGSKIKKKRKKHDEDVIYGDSDEDEDLHFSSTKKINTANITRKKRYTNALGNEVKKQDSHSTEPGQWGDTLPKKVLHRIFQHLVDSEGCVPSLVRVSKVCRLWRDVAVNPELWTTVDLSSGKVKDAYRSERNLIYFLENKISHVKHLNLGGWESAITPAVVEVLAQSCTNLESLNLSTCHKLSAQSLNSITSSCLSLSKLDLSNVSPLYNAKNAVSVSGIGESAESMGDRLQQLALANNCMGSLPQVISSLAEHCPNLQVLDLSSVISPRRDTIIIKIEQLQQGCPLLRIFRLTNSEIIFGETSYKDQIISQGFTKLEELSIAVDPKRSPGLDDNDLEKLVKNSIKLRLLDVRGCTKITDSGLVRVPAWDLEHLYLSGCLATKSSTDGLELLVRKWKHSFKEIDISWTPSEEALTLAIAALSEPFQDESGFPKSPPIKILDLCGSSVTFESVQLLLKSCANLQSLNLTSCRALPRGIKRNYQSPYDIKSLREQVQAGKFTQENND